MKLYHGTTAAALPAIIGYGLQPRQNSGNWSTCPSKEGFVYLTKPYPVYFAVSAVNTAARDMSKKKAAKYRDSTPLLVVEVDTDLLDECDFCPDEDFISQAILQNRKRGQLTGNKALDQTESLADLTNLIDPMDYRQNWELQNWELSVEMMGQCCHYGEIPTEAITRYALINPDRAWRIVGEALEPTISIFNYRIIGAYYDELTAFIMGDRPDPPLARNAYMKDIAGSDGDQSNIAAIEEALYAGISPEMAAKWRQHNADRREAMAVARREGVVVTSIAPA